MKRINRFAVFLLIPALVVIVLVLLFPVVQTVVLSFGRNSTSLFQNFDLSGFSNYRRLFATPRFITATLNTLFFTAVTIPFELVLGMVLAILLNRQLPAQGLVRMAILFPWALPTALNALMWRWMFNGEYGLFNAALVNSGIAADQINWLGSVPLAMYSMMFVSIWKTSSFVALLLLAGLQSIPKDIYEAAEVEGVTAWTRLRYITLPLLQPAILVSILLRTMDAIRAFELPLNLTDGGPLTSTETLSLYAYRVIFQYVNFNLGSSAIVIQFLIIMFVAGFYLVILRRDAYA